MSIAEYITEWKSEILRGRPAERPPQADGNADDRCNKGAVKLQRQHRRLARPSPRLGTTRWRQADLSFSPTHLIVDSLTFYFSSRSYVRSTYVLSRHVRSNGTVMGELYSLERKIFSETRFLLRNVRTNEMFPDEVAPRKNLSSLKEERASNSFENEEEAIIGSCSEKDYKIIRRGKSWLL